MKSKQEKLNQALIQTSELHAALWHSLQDVVPHWNPRITRAFIKDLVPLWQHDILEQPRQIRFLKLAMRLGWFDEAASATRWTLFIRLVQHAPAPITPITSVNLFNFVAALPDPSQLSSLDDYLSTQLLQPNITLDAHALTQCIHYLISGETSSSTPSRTIKNPEYFHHLDSTSLSHKGTHWLSLPWDTHKLTPLALIDPFGKQPWHFVSKLGMDPKHNLVAYNQPEDIHTIIPTHSDALLGYTPEPRLTEPLHLQQPNTTPSPQPSVVPTLFQVGPHTLAGLTLDGSVALFLTDSK